MGLLDFRRRKHAHDIDVAIPLVKNLLERMEAPDFPGHQFPFTVLDVEATLGAAESLRDGLLAGDTPEPSFMRHVQRACRECIRALKDVHPGDVAGYMDLLASDKDRRLIRSMWWSAPGRRGP